MRVFSRLVRCFGRPFGAALFLLSLSPGAMAVTGKMHCYGATGSGNHLNCAGSASAAG